MPSDADGAISLRPEPHARRRRRDARLRRLGDRRPSVAPSSRYHEDDAAAMRSFIAAGYAMLHGPRGRRVLPESLRCSRQSILADTRTPMRRARFSMLKRERNGDFDVEVGRVTELDGR